MVLRSGSGCCPNEEAGLQHTKPSPNHHTTLPRRGCMHLQARKESPAAGPPVNGDKRWVGGRPSTKAGLQTAGDAEDAEWWLQIGRIEKGPRPSFPVVVGADNASALDSCRSARTRTTFSWGCLRTAGRRANIDVNAGSARAMASNAGRDRNRPAQIRTPHHITTPNNPWRTMHPRHRDSPASCAPTRSSFGRCRPSDGGVWLANPWCWNGGLALPAGLHSTKYSQDFSSRSMAGRNKLASAIPRRTQHERVRRGA